MAWFTVNRCIATMMPAGLERIITLAEKFYLFKMSTMVDKFVANWQHFTC